MVPAVPVTVSERAYGAALLLVFIVRVEEPLPAMDGGLNPPLVMPLGNPDSLPTLRLTEPPNPFTGVTVTVKFVDWPGRTAPDEGVTAIEKSALGGSTVMARVGGLGSELPLESIRVNEATYQPGVLNVTLPGF
jgi:hypothetical protein